MLALDECGKSAIPMSVDRMILELRMIEVPKSRFFVFINKREGRGEGME